jgi:hypothetical protein
MTTWPNKSLQATRDGRLSSASRFMAFPPACLSSGRSAAFSFDANNTLGTAFRTYEFPAGNTWHSFLAAVVAAMIFSAGLFYAQRSRRTNPLERNGRSSRRLDIGFRFHTFWVIAPVAHRER